MEQLLLLFALALPLFASFGVGAVVGETDWIEVFRAGSYPQGTFTPADVEHLAKSYDPAYLEAPVTVDHEQSGPAFGWISKVKNEAGRLWVKLKQVPEAFAEAINEGRFRSRSVELARDLDGSPEGGLYLKALTFLGAKAPQIKGLEPVGKIGFSQGVLGAEAVSVHFSEADDEADVDPDVDPETADDAVPEPDDPEADPSQPETPDADEAEQTQDSPARRGAPARRNTDADTPEEALPKDSPSSEAASSEAEEEEDDEDDDASFASVRQEIARLQDANQQLAERLGRQEAQEASEEFARFCAERVPPRVRSRALAIFTALSHPEVSAQGHIQFSHAEDDDAVTCFKALLEELSLGYLFGAFAHAPEETSTDSGDLTGAVRESMAEEGLI